MTAGEQLSALVATATQEVVLVAPFIKRWALDRVLADLPSGVALRCLTRWLPPEVASGVSDVEVLDVVSGRRGSLWLRADLHAKYFRIDDRAIVGSANLTGKALGWSASPNLELVLDVPVTDQLTEFEEVAFADATMATAELQAEVAELALVFRSFVSVTEDRPTELPPEREHEWCPVTRSPGRLYEVYASDTRRVTAAGAAQAQADLEWLAFPPGLDRASFNRAVAVALLQAPLIQRIDAFVSEPRRFGEVRRFLADHLHVDNADAEAMWQTTMRWLQVFLPDRYEISRPRHTELIVRKE